MADQYDDWKNLRFGRVITEEELSKRTDPVWPYKYFDPGLPVEKEHVDALIEGGIDIHLHGAPSSGWLPGRPKLIDTAIKAGEMRMKALVFKDLNGKTNNAAIIIEDMIGMMAAGNSFGEDFRPAELYGGIVLNYPSGGINPAAVKSALEYGRCKMVWLPSSDAAHQYRLLGREGGIRVSDGRGTLTEEMTKVLDMMADFNANSRGDRTCLSCSHVSNAEKFDLLRYIKKRGMDIKVCIDHCTQELTMVTPDEAREMIELGAYLEFSSAAIVPWPGMKDWILAYGYSFGLMKELIKEKGPEHLVVTSDAGQPGNEHEGSIRNFIRELVSQGFSDEEIRVMFKETPARLLGIE
jgi:hypothetical protein